MDSVLVNGGRMVAADYGLQRSLLMKLLFCKVQALDGWERTSLNARGILPELMTLLAFSVSWKNASFPRPRGQSRSIPGNVHTRRSECSSARCWDERDNPTYIDTEIHGESRCRSYARLKAVLTAKNGAASSDSPMMSRFSGAPRFAEF